MNCAPADFFFGFDVRGEGFGVRGAFPLPSDPEPRTPH